MKISRSMLTAIALSALAVPAMAAIRPCATPITIAPGTLTVATTGIAYTQTLTASGGTAYTFSATKGGLPAGVSLTNATATTVDIAGLATAPGTSVFTVTARNTADGCSGGRTFSLSVNDRTVVTTTPGTTAFTEDAGAVVVDAGLTVTDSDSALTSATVTITNPQDGAAEVLSASACAGLTVTPGLNSLSITGSQPPATYQTCLRSVTYGNSSQNPGITARVLSFVASDGIASSATANKGVSVARVDDAPIANPISPAAFNEDTPSTITLSYADVEGDLATACAVTGLTNVTVSTPCACTTGVCTVGVTGTSNYNGPASFSYTVTANTLTSNSAAASLTINAVPDPPVANPITPPAFDEDVAATITLSYTDPDGDQATACAVTAPTNVTVTTACACAAGVCTVGVTGTSNYNGPASFSFTVTANAQTSNSATASLTVTAVNDAPVLGGVTGGFTYTENDAATVIAGALTVTDVDSTNLSSATVTISAGFQSGQDVLSFTPAGSITGSFSGNVLTLTSAPPSTLAQWQAVLRTVRYNNSSDDPSTAVRTATFQVNDGAAANNLSNQVSRTVTVTAVNDAPIANGFTGQPAQAGIPITYPAGKLGGTDLEAGTTITIDLTPINVTNGTVSLSANGSFTFTPLPSATTGSFQYRVSDNGNPAPGVTGAYATVSFTVAGPAIYFVKSTAVGLGNCTLGNECTLATAVTNIGASTNARIFISDANSHGAAVPLNSGGWVIGQGVTGTTFDTLFGIGAPAQGTLAPRPSLAGTRPTITNTVTLNTNGAVRGLNISTTTATGITDPAGAITGAQVGEVAVTTTTGTAVSFSNTAGSFGFSGVTTTGGAGVSLTGANAGGTFDFSGVSISSGANAAFAATGGGTVQVTGATNTLAATTGTALNVANTTIGASGLTFRSIASSGGTATGIILDTTGSAGGLTVTGDGTNTTRGGNGTGGTISNKTGADGLTAQGNGIYLNSTSNVSLARMQLNGFSNSAIRGFGVTGFTFRYSTINGTSGDNTAPTEGAITMGTILGPNGLAGGTNLIDNCLVSGAIEHNLEFYNYQAGSNYSLTVSNSDVKSNSVAGGSDGIQMETGGSYAGTATVVVNAIAFDDNKSQAVQASALGSSTIDITVSNSTIQRTSQGNEGILLANGADGTMIAHVTGNTITGLGGATIFVGQVPGNANASAAPKLVAVVRNNNITHPATATNHAIIAFLSSTVGQVSRANILIDGNTVNELSTGGTSRPILVDTPDNNTTPTFTATVINNQVSVDPTAGATMDTTARRGDGCFDVRNNTATGGFGVRVRQVAPATVQLEQGVSTSTVAATVLDDNHAAGTPTSVLGTVTVVGNNTCLNAPTVPPEE